MVIKIIRKNNQKAFEDACNEAISHGYKLFQAFISGDSKLIGVLENGDYEAKVHSAKLDEELVKENTTLNKQLEECNALNEKLNKEMDLLQDQVADAQNKCAEALSAGEAINTSLDACQKENKVLKAQNTKLKKKVAALIESEANGE